jgi:5'-methylthioadenosine phosphorylase
MGAEVARIGFVGGSGFSTFGEARLEADTVRTAFGPVPVASGEVGGHTVAFVSRHGLDHRRLSHQVQHRANIRALKDLAVEAIVASTAVGLLQRSIPLAVPILFDDLYFPSNRLPDGELATFFTEAGDPQRGHWIPGEPFSPTLRLFLARAAARISCPAVRGGCYAHADGPRFNTRAEHAALHAAGAIAVSQTCGPEAVLSGELGIPYALVGFGVNYIDGASLSAAAGEDLATLLGRHAAVVGALQQAFLEVVPAAFAFPLDTGSMFQIREHPG